MNTLEVVYDLLVMEATPHHKFLSEGVASLANRPCVLVHVDYRTVGDTVQQSYSKSFTTLPHCYLHLWSCSC